MRTVNVLVEVGLLVKEAVVKDFSQNEWNFYTANIPSKKCIFEELIANISYNLFSIYDYDIYIFSIDLDP